MTAPAVLERLFNVHLADLRDDVPNWCIAESPVAGRGAFATRDIAPGEVIFRERALVVGPTAREGSALNTCVCCHKLLPVKNFLCKRQCTLPVCDLCADAEVHRNECELFRRWRPLQLEVITKNQNNNNNSNHNANNDKHEVEKKKQNNDDNNNNNNSNTDNTNNDNTNTNTPKNENGVGKTNADNNTTTTNGSITADVVDAANAVNTLSLRILTAIRVYFLSEDQRALVDAMQANPDRCYRQEIIKAAQCFRKFPTTDRKFMDWLFHVVGVLNTNAFEAPVCNGDYETLVRGLYPLTAIMNHECTPNASHYFDKSHMAVVRASRHIPQGAEITTTYTKILWSNLTRNIFLKMTKHFMCDCVRCNDNTENGTYLSALLCRAPDCKGIVIPVQTKTMQPDWRCVQCETVFPHAKMARYQDFALNTINNRINVSSVHDMIRFINEMCPRFCPPSNYVLVEAKMNVIWRMTRLKKDDIYTPEEWEHCDRYRQEILELLAKLGAGECTLKRLITHEIE